MTLATPDEVHFSPNGTKTTVAGVGFAQEFHLQQEEMMTVKMNANWAPAQTVLVVNVTAVNRSSNSWCPSYPVLQVGRSAPMSTILPASGFNCHGSSEPTTVITLCGSEFNDQQDGTGTGTWYLTVAAAGFTEMQFEMHARVVGSALQANLTAALTEYAQVSQQLTSCTAELATDMAKVQECQEELAQNGGSTSKGVSNGIAALLFFIGVMVGGAAGWATTRFFCFPKGIGFSSVPSSSAPSNSGYSNSLTFTKGDGGSSLLGQESNPVGNSNL